MLAIKQVISFGLLMVCVLLLEVHDLRLEIGKRGLSGYRSKEEEPTEIEGGGEKPRSSSRPVSTILVHPGHLDIEPNDAIQYTPRARDEVCHGVRALSVRWAPG